jgi:hypothetical protein
MLNQLILIKIGQYTAPCQKEEEGDTKYEEELSDQSNNWFRKITGRSVQI